jgi:hypothetical protein
MESKKTRVIAFYLPQYHPFPENDEWWGKGFTEWTNVGKAKPLFRGHYQPRVPADLGYYDLRMPEIREAQAQMAREAGIEGFMYWHYWFGKGKRLMANIFDEVLTTGKPDFPFCLGWANHSWTTHTWNNKTQWQKDGMLIEQQYPGEKDYIEHFYTVLSAFKDKRYICVEGKPMFLVYEPLKVPEMSKFIQLWKKLAVENGLSGLHFVGLSGGWLKYNQEILELGFDAIATGNQWLAQSKTQGKYLHLLLHKIRSKLPIVSLDKYKYKNIIKHLFTEYDKLEYAYPSIIPQWDRSPRGGRRAVIYTGATPELFKKHLMEALAIVSTKPEEKRILFLRSWNEWAEGNYVEPDIKFGHGYLDVLEECLIKIPNGY